MHSIKPPKKPTTEAPVDVGPIVDQSGVDLGPVVASRINERGLGKAQYVSAPGDNPYVSGKIRLEKGDAGFTAANWGGWTLASIGGTGLIVGTILYGFGAGAKGSSSLASTGVTVDVLSAFTLAGGIALLFQPSRHRDGEVNASLEVRRGPTATTIEASDKATVYHGYLKDDQAGGPMLDGVVNAISKETSK
jgi:hypothetical protein